MATKGTKSWLLATWLLVACHAASAANLLQNADFAQADGLSSWLYFDSFTAQVTTCSGTSPCGSFTYVADDECCGQPSSGSALSHVQTRPSMLYQCVPGIVANTAYDFGAWLRLVEPLGSWIYRIQVTVTWFPSTDCSGSGSSGTRSSSISATDWTRVGVPAQIAPPGTQSAWFIIRDGGYTAPTEIDSVFFGPSGTVPVELQFFSVD